MSMLALRDLLISQSAGGSLTPVPEVELARIRQAYPWLVEDYFEQLRVVGHGTVGNSHYRIYSGPLAPDAVFDPDTAADLVDVVLVGDDFAGDCEAYALRGERCEFGSVGCDGRFVPHVGSSFVEFLRSWFTQG